MQRLPFPSALLLAGCLFPSASALPAAPAQESAQDAVQELPVPQAVAPLTQVVFIGASVTAGFGNATEMQLGRNAPLSTFFQAALAPEHAALRPKAFGSDMFFDRPTKEGRSQVDSAIREKATLVVAMDFLFWYGFGGQSQEHPRRAEGLAEGLRQLERLKVPLIVGDLPRIDHALRGVGPHGGPMVGRWQLPSEEERAQMNETIYAWADAREHVEVVSLSSLMEQMSSGTTIEIQGQKWESPKLTDVLLPDLLHPTVRGTLWAAMAVADVATRVDGVDAADFRFSYAELKESLDQTTHEARMKHRKRVAAAAERQAKREARKRAREAADQAKGGR